jgi:L-lactate dehydrogenase complex protein LldG
MSEAREAILARTRTALGPGTAAPVSVPRDYATASSVDTEPDGSHRKLHQLVATFIDRLHDYGATVVQTSADGVGDAIAAQVRGVVRVAPGLPWAVPGAQPDGGGRAAELDLVDTAVTACAAACATTGTIVLDGSPDQGRRALTLVPDRHVCVVHSGQIVDIVPELVARLDPRRPLTFISGPSATSDIELQRVQGVHGPRQLVVIVVTSSSEGLHG